MQENSHSGIFHNVSLLDHLYQKIMQLIPWLKREIPSALIKLIHTCSLTLNYKQPLSYKAASACIINKISSKARACLLLSTSMLHATKLCNYAVCTCITSQQLCRVDMHMYMYTHTHVYACLRLGTQWENTMWASNGTVGDREPRNTH